MTVWFSSSWCNVYLCLGDSNEQSIYDNRQEIKSRVVSMLQNWNQRYSSHNSNIKCVDSTIKCIGFESFHFAINVHSLFLNKLLFGLIFLIYGFVRFRLLLLF